MMHTLRRRMEAEFLHKCLIFQEIAGCQLFQVRILERLHQSRQLLIHYLDIL